MIHLNEMLARALAHHQAGRLGEAERIYRAILAEAPAQPAALHYLGVVALQMGRPADAARLIEQSLAQSPNAGGYNNLGEAYRALQEFERAKTAFLRAIELEPGSPLQQNNLGLNFLDQNDVAAAETHLSRAIELDPNYPAAINNFGTVRQQQGRWDEAERLFRQALTLKPAMSAAEINLANLMAATHRFDEAIAHAETALRLAPADPKAHLAVAMTRLTHGDFERGWPEYEWRLQKFPFLRRAFDKPQWLGEPLTGRTILLHAEQGFGDIFQFCRFVPVVASMGGRVIVECPRVAADLVKTVSGAAATIQRGQPLPPFDVHCSLVSSPGVLKVNLATIPAKTPYLVADADKVARWRERIAGDGARFRVGLSWAGNPMHENDTERSARLADLAELDGAGEGVVFYSLQKGAAADQAKHPPARMRLIDVADDLHDFSDTAGLMMCLDAVVGVDTAPVHLAGALARPVWTLLAFSAEWRWLHDRDDSPWYPTMRLVRQSTPRDWSGVAKRAAAALHDHFFV